MFSRLLPILTTVLIAKVTFSVVVGYRDYFPPNFDSDFLLGREGYFWGAYRWAFYVHLLSGPLSLVLGMLLVSARLRRWAPKQHRRLGKLQIANVLLFVAPSGLWMAWYAVGGAVAAAGLGTLAILTAVFVALGWRAAMQRRFADHERWMWRMYLLLCSAVVIRIIGGLTTVLQVDEPWVYALSTWISWLAPLAVNEFHVGRFSESGAAVKSEQS